MTRHEKVRSVLPAENQFVLVWNLVDAREPWRMQNGAPTLVIIRNITICQVREGGRFGKTGKREIAAATRSLGVGALVTHWRRRKPPRLSVGSVAIAQPASAGGSKGPQLNTRHAFFSFWQKFTPGGNKSSPYYNLVP
jgi:hypothetical protein